MKKRVISVMLFCYLGLLGISVEPVEGQEGQGNRLMNWVLGVQPQEAAAQGLAEAAIREEEGIEGPVTPSHVFQSTLDVLSEIEVLRTEMAIDDYPSQAEPQEGRSPFHVYAKTLEVLRKVARVQRKLGIIPVAPEQLPVKEITPTDVLGSVQIILEELRRTKGQLVIETEIAPGIFCRGQDAVPGL